MKSFLKILIPLLLLVFVLAPGVTGFLVESAVDNNEGGMEMALDNAPVSLLSNSFDRGWFGSEQTTELSFDDPKYAAILHQMLGAKNVQELPTLLIETKATHGVLPMANPSNGGLKPAIAQTESQLFLKYGNGEKVALPVTVYSSVGTGKWAKLVAQPIDQSMDTPHGEAALKWDGGTVETNVGSSITLTGDIGNLHIESDDGIVQLKAITFSGDYTPGDYSFPESHSEIHIPQASVSAGSGMELSLNNLKANGSMEVIRGRAMAGAKLMSDGMTLPNFDIDSADIAMNYDVDAAALSRVYELLGQKRQSEAQGSQVGAPDAAQMMEAMGAVLQKGGKVSLDKIDVSLNGSKVHLEFNLDIPPGHDDPMTALQNGKGRGEFIIPQDVIDLLTIINPDIAGAIQMGAGIGFIEKRGNAYTAKVEFEDGLLTLNGLPLPLPF